MKTFPGKNITEKADKHGKLENAFELEAISVQLLSSYDDFSFSRGIEAQKKKLRKSTTGGKDR